MRGLSNGPNVSAIFQELLDDFKVAVETPDAAIVADFLDDFDWDMPGRALTPTFLPCLRHLAGIAKAAPPPGDRLARLMAGHVGAFHWRQTYTEADFGRHFVENYGWIEVFGTRGHFSHDRVAGGLLLLGPNVVYPDHHHEAEEVYIPLTGGSEWRMGDGAFARRPAGEVIHHGTNVNHAMRTGGEPLLALYLWRGGPLAVRPTVTGTVAEASR